MAVAIGLAVACLALLLGFLPRRSPQQRSASRLALPALPELVAATPSRPLASSNAGPLQAPVLPGRAGPVIESVEIEKDEVCLGEENLATVRARDDSGSSDRLIVRLGGSSEMGFRLPFHIEESEPRRPLEVLVQGPGGFATAKVPQPRIKDCQADQRVEIDVSFDIRSPHVLRLAAKVSSRPQPAGPLIEPASYNWDFGDGTKATTAEAELEHSYEGRPQVTRFSYFLIKVGARNKAGREVQGSRAYGFANFGFGPFVDDQRIVLFAAGGSAPGEHAAGGEHIRIYHGFDGTVQLERVLSRQIDRSRKVTGAVTEYSPKQLLGLDELLPGASSPTLDLSALRPSEPGMVRELEIIGHAGSFEAQGRIVLSSTEAAVASGPFGG